MILDVVETFTLAKRDSLVSREYKEYYVPKEERINLL